MRNKKTKTILSGIILIMIIIVFLFVSILIGIYDFKGKQFENNTPDEAIKDLYDEILNGFDNYKSGDNDDLIFLFTESEINNLTNYLLSDYKERNGIIRNNKTYLVTVDSKNYFYGISDVWFNFDKNKLTINAALEYDGFIKYQTIVKIEYRVISTIEGYTFLYKSMHFKNIIIPKFVLKAVLNSSKNPISYLINDFFSNIPIAEFDNEDLTVKLKAEEISKSISDGYISQFINSDDRFKDFISEFVKMALDYNLISVSFKEELLETSIAFNKIAYDFMINNNSFPNAVKNSYSDNKIIITEDDLLRQRNNKKMEILLLENVIFTQEQLNRMFLYNLERINNFRINFPYKSEDALDNDVKRMIEVLLAPVWLDIYSDKIIINYVLKIDVAYSIVKLTYKKTASISNNWRYRLDKLTIGEDEKELNVQYTNLDDFDSFASTLSALGLPPFTCFSSDGMYLNVESEKINQYFFNELVEFEEPRISSNELVIKVKNDYKEEINSLFTDLNFINGILDVDLKKSLLGKEENSYSEFIRIFEYKDLNSQKNFMEYLVNYVKLNNLEIKNYVANLIG